jgi:hypothetical protein
MGSMQKQVLSSLLKKANRRQEVSEIQQNKNTYSFSIEVKQSKKGEKKWGDREKKVREPYSLLCILSGICKIKILLGRLNELIIILEWVVNDHLF